MTDQPTDQPTDHTDITALIDGDPWRQGYRAADHGADQAAPIGYAVVEEREGDYAPPLTRDTFTLSDVYTVAGQPDLTDDQARDMARYLADTLARGRNHRDAETVATWHVVALVPVRRP